MEIYQNLQGGPVNQSDGQLDIPILDRVVTWDSDGSPLSFYHHDIWDFSAFSPSTKTRRFDFTHWCRKDFSGHRELINEAKFLIYLIVWARRGYPLSITTVRHYFDLIILMCRYAAGKKIALFEVLSDEDILSDLILNRKPNQLRCLAPLIAILQQFSVGDLGFSVVGRTQLMSVRALRSELRIGERQHPPLPTRIYSLFIAKLIADLECNEQIIASLLAVVIEVDQYRKGQRKDCKYLNRAEFIELLGRYGLYEHFVSRGFDLSTKGVHRAVLETYVSCKLMVHTFSGMRDGEVEFLPYDCLAPLSEKGGKHYLIAGYTTKFANGKRKKSKWVTSVEGYRAIKIVQNISSTIYSLISGGGIIPNDAPLFLSMGMLRNGRRNIWDLNTAVMDLCKFERLKRRFVSEIKDEDLTELQNIDPYRYWGVDDEFQIGRPWPLTVHQLRRSLALYASRSGLVTLPSLKRQLKHITAEMTRYYTSGRFFAINILEEDKEHFSVQYMNTQPESQVLSLIKNVLDKKETLYGAAGGWLQKPRDVEITKEERSETIKKAKNGMLGFQDTPVGGCTKVGDCPHRSFGQFSHCVSGCESSVIDPIKLNIVIESQERHVQRLPINSVMRHNEQAVLDDYLLASIKIINRGAGYGADR